MTCICLDGNWYEGNGVLLNIATEADEANRTRGGIQDIILDEREDPLTTDDEGTITLKYPPAMLLFQPDKKSRPKFPGLLPGIIPLTPSIAPFETQWLADQGKSSR